MNPNNNLQSNLKEVSYLVYETTNLKNNMIYVGVHATDNINDFYLGSGIELKKAVKEFGRENFKRKILYIFDNELDALDMEAEIVNEEFITREDTYNIIVGGGGLKTKGFCVMKDRKGNIIFTKKDDSRRNSGELTGIHKNKKLTKEHCLRISKANTGKKRIIKIYKNRKCSLKTRELLSKAHKGKKLSLEHIEKLKIARKNRKPISQETRNKMSKSRKGIRVTEETKTKLSLIKKGKPLSEYHKIKLREARNKYIENKKLFSK